MCRFSAQREEERRQARPIQEARWKRCAILYLILRLTLIKDIIIADPERIGDSPDQDTSPGPPGVNTLESSSSGPPPAGAFMTPVTFGPGFYGQYAMPQTGQPGEAPPTYFPQFYIAQPPQPPPNPDGNPQAYSQPQYFPAFVPFGGGYAPYMVQRPDGQIVPSYAMYARPPGAETPSDPVMTSRVEHVVAEEKEEEPGDPSV